MHRTMLLTILVSLALALAGCADKGADQAAEGKKGPEKKIEPKAAEPKAAEPKVEEPKPAEADKVDEPKVEEPKVDEPKTEAPKAAEPKAGADGKPSIEDRRKRVQEIYRLGRSEAPEDLEKLKVIILDGALPGYERATAIRALGTKPRAEMVETLKTLMADKDLAISSEAAIMMFQWGEKEIATPKLKELQTMGIALRRAFFKGLKDGNYEYAPEAEEFFKAAVDAPQAHVRLDAALGLLHLGQTEVALGHFRKALAKEEKSYVRLTAVSYLASARKVPEVQALLEEAAEDADPKVAARAQQILKAGKSLVKPTVAPRGHRRVGPRSGARSG